MFGFVTANIKDLTTEDKKIYSGYYCGLCNTLKNYGNFSRLTLNYDMTFLYIFLSSYFNEFEEKYVKRCALHPLKPKNVYVNKYAEYASDMTVLLAYYKLEDDENDDDSKRARLFKSALKSAFLKAEAKHKEKSERIKELLSKLYEIEKSGEHNPDIPAKVFGEILGTVFDIFDNDSVLFEFGEALGKVVYIMDACVDVKRDIKKCRYNPMVEIKREKFQQILTILLSDCTEIYDKMNIEKNKSIIDNILYSGIWQVFWRNFNGSV